MKKYDSILLGAIIGAITAIISLIIFYFYKYDYISFTEYIDLLFRNKSLFAPLVSLAGIPNLLIFFFFINRSKYQTSRGIILATFILVLTVAMIKLFG